MIHLVVSKNRKTACINAYLMTLGGLVSLRFLDHSTNLELGCKLSIRPSDNQPFDCTTFVLTLHGSELRLFMGQGIY